MGRIPNQRVDRTEADKHLNFMGGAGYDLADPIKTLRMAAASCFFGEPRYYQQDADDHRRPKATSDVSVSRLSLVDTTRLRASLGATDPQSWRDKTPAEAIEDAIDASLNLDPEGTLLLAVELRNEHYIRTTPQVILVRAAHHPKVRGSGLVRKHGPGIIKRADEPAVGLAYHSWRYPGKPLPNSLKKAWANALAGFNEYQLAKYRMESKGSKTVDVVNLVHPNSPAIGKLVRGELKTTGQTWEAILSANGSTPEAWREALKVMGHMALLRNMRNLLQKGVPPELFINELVASAPTGKQLPFRYFSAYKAVEGMASGKVLDAIEGAMIISLKNLPRFSGRTMSLCDNSGSAKAATTSSMGTMAINEIANLTGVLTGMVSEDGYLGVFGDGLQTFAVRERASIFDQVKKAKVLGESDPGRTENGVWMFWDQAIKKRERWDNVFIYSDMQAGHGGLYGLPGQVPSEYVWNRAYMGSYGNRPYVDISKLINRYRAEVNAYVNVFLVQVAGYQDTILPEFYRRTYILGGWSDGVFRFAAEMSRLNSGERDRQAPSSGGAQ